MMTRIRRRPQGFTLIELMVALVAGLIAIATIYTLSRASSRHFHEQQRISQTQMAVRMATEQIRRDVQRAGFMGTPNTFMERRCFDPPQHFGAVEFLDNADPGALPNAVVNQVEADRLRLIGNFVTGDSYFVAGLISPGNDTVPIQREWQGFRRSFGADANYSPDAFTNVFRPGRWVHVVTPQQRHIFSEIQGSNGGGGASRPTVTFNHGNCVIPNGSIISPLMRIEYLVVDGTYGPLQQVFGSAADQALDQARGFQNSVLIRREIGFTDGLPVVNTDRVVLEYVADFNLTFVLDNQNIIGQPPVLQLHGTANDVAAGHASFGAAAAQLRPPGGGGGTPHHVRSVIVDLAARTADESPNFLFVPRPNRGTPLTRYEANTDLDGAARVRAAHAEIFLPNIRVMRP